MIEQKLIHLEKEVIEIKTTMVTKADLNQILPTLATKADLNQILPTLATKADLHKVEKEVVEIKAILPHLATHKDLNAQTWKLVTTIGVAFGLTLTIMGGMLGVQYQAFSNLLTSSIKMVE